MSNTSNMSTPSTQNSPSTGSQQSSAPAQGLSGEQFRVIRKRNRIPLSCAPCRSRKLKCNRASPCDNCTKRGDTANCTYATPSGRRKQTSRTNSASSPDDMQNRIDRLEGLVLSLMTNGSDSAGPAAAQQALANGNSIASGSDSGYPRSEDMLREHEESEEGSETDKVTNSLGVLHVKDNGKSIYIGEAHWAAILNDISEVRNYYTEHKQMYEDQMQKVEQNRRDHGLYTGPAFLFGGRNLPAFSDLVSALPGKDAVDKMVTRFFNDYDVTCHILHAPSWRRMYEKHWQDSSKTDPAFLGQLFAIMTLAQHSYHKSEDEPYEYKGRTLSLANNFRSLASQCLLLADFTKPHNYMLETLILYLMGEMERTREAETGIWVLVGMIVRLAMRMGLHRDPKTFPHVTPFHAEMRRRVWTYIRQSDLIFSFQIGLPNMIRTSDCDTGPPTNLFDHEFDEDTKVMPPGHPMNVFTPTSYMLGKSQLAFAFGRIVEILHNIKSPPYEEIMKLDQDLREAYATIPPLLRLKPLGECQQDPASNLVMRFNIAILYHKGQCVLHRRYLSRARENSRYAHSRRTCVDSALELLKYQATMHIESRPRGRLRSMKWYISSITSHDFLLASTLVCLDLWYSAQAESMGKPIGDYEMWGYDRRDEMLNAIQTSRDIWTELRDQSMEAFKASEIMGVMIHKIHALHSQTTARKAQGAYASLNGGPTNGPQLPTPNPPSQQYSPPEEEKPEHTAAMTLGMLSSGGISPGQQQSSGQPLYGSAFPPTPSSNDAVMDNASSAQNLSAPFATDQGAFNAASPFSFFQNANGTTLDVPLDWDALEVYLQQPNIDPAIEMWNQTQNQSNANGSGEGPPEQQMDGVGQQAQEGIGSTKHGGGVIPQSSAWPPGSGLFSG